MLLKLQFVLYIWIRRGLLFTSLAETIYLLYGGCRPTPQGRARCDRRADRRVSPGAAQHPRCPGLTPLGGRLPLGCVLDFSQGR